MNITILPFAIRLTNCKRLIWSFRRLVKKYYLGINLSLLRANRWTFRFRNAKLISTFYRIRFVNSYIASITLLLWSILPQTFSGENLTTRFLKTHQRFIWRIHIKQAISVIWLFDWCSEHYPCKTCLSSISVEAFELCAS